MADIKTVVNNLQRRFSRALTTKDMRDLGKLAAKAIVDRTKAGRGVRNTGGNERKLKKLSTQYIEFRKKQTLDPSTSPATSNLTFSGDMLRSIKTISVKTGTRGNGELIVGPVGRKNIRKATFVSVDRPFMNLSGKDIKKLIDLMTKRIRSNIRGR